jgi:LysM repeat protein
MAPIQMAPGQMAPPTLVQPQTGNGGAPATFQNGTTPSSLNDVPSVSPVEAMNLPPNPKPTTWHTVKPGETFTSISQSYGVPLDVLMKANFFDQVPNLTPGQHIMIP